MMRGLVWFPVCVLLLVGSFTTGGLAQSPDVEAESKSVKAVLEAGQKAGHARDLNGILAVYSDDAMIDSKVARGKVSKSTYKDALTKGWERDTTTWAEYRNVQVAVNDATHAVATGMIYIHLQNGKNIIQKHEWKLEKRDGHWLIVETNYQ